jgi:hypothetical protein
MSNITIPLNGVYFDQIKAGTKLEEYRLVNDYWTKRLLFRNYDRLILTRGYPRKDDEGRRINLKYRGFEVRDITHPHFGPEPVQVFAIKIDMETQE